MIRIYCRAKHKHSDGLCPECESLALYACQRLERCKFGEQKTSCQRCPIHCYKQERKALQNIGKNYCAYLSDDAKRNYKNLDIRFTNDKLSILVETKQDLKGNNLSDGLIQLQNYVNFEKELSKNKIIAILSSTNRDELYVWYYTDEPLSLETYSKIDRKFKTFEEYYNVFFNTKNDKVKLTQSTYELNELLHTC